MVYGEPGRTVLVTVPEDERRFVRLYATDDPLETAAGPLSGRDGRFLVTLDPAGRGRFLVGSTGAFTDAAFPEHYARRVELELSYADVPTARQADPVTLGLLTVYLVKKYGWVTLQDVAKEFVWGALAGEGDSLAAISGDLALGALPFLGIFADGRDIVIARILLRNRICSRTISEPPREAALVVAPVREEMVLVDVRTALDFNQPCQFIAGRSHVIAKVAAEIAAGVIVVKKNAASSGRSGSITTTRARGTTPSFRPCL